MIALNSDDDCRFPHLYYNGICHGCSELQVLNATTLEPHCAFSPCNITIGVI